MILAPETRRANRWLLVGLICFAVGLCALVMVWMRVTVRAKGGIVDPQRPHAVLWRPAAPAWPVSVARLALEFSREPLLTAHPYHL